MAFLGPQAPGKAPQDARILLVFAGLSLDWKAAAGFTGAMETKRPYPRFDRLLHGGDYNPDQWLHNPEVIDEDFRLFPLAGVNTVSINIFSWTRLEPKEGKYDFGWLDSIMDRLAASGMKAILASPSGAKPAWMSQKYPEIRRCDSRRIREDHGKRHNHCYTSPVYREKALALNTLLARRYARHPALLMWHVSNEYGGECHCPLCQAAFRTWLCSRYASLEELNQAWWTGFWSHRFTDWSQVESPGPNGEDALHGLSLDWKRFVDHQSRDFFLHESAPFRTHTPGVPITVNMMGTYPGLDYRAWAEHVDLISWDNYPAWHNPWQSEADEASRTAFVHDLMRSLKKDRPWLLMESTPSQVNWQEVNRLKAPGLHRLSSLQALAHGSDGVLYFQWRKGRGGSEKYHGAVVDHCGHEHTRVFTEVAHLGRELAGLAGLTGSLVKNRATLVYDWDNRWAIEGYQGFSRAWRDYEGWCSAWHRSLWKKSIGCDVTGQADSLGDYDLILAPWVHMVKGDFATRLADRVAKGATAVLSFQSGMVDQHDLCFTGGFPGPLKELCGLVAEECDALWPGQHNSLVPLAGNSLGLTSGSRLESVCELIKPTDAQVLAVYGDDWYQGQPVLTCREHGQGRVYWLASRTDQQFLDSFLGLVSGQAGLKSALPGLPPGVNAQIRRSRDRDWRMVMNFSAQPAAGLGAWGWSIEEGSPGAFD